MVSLYSAEIKSERGIFVKVKRYHECPECHRITPYFQSKCDCGYHFSGIADEREYKACPSCGLMVPAGQFVCDCGKFLPFCKDSITDADIELAYEAGRRAGVSQERARSGREWDDFFIRASLKNSITGEPIMNRGDFAKWETDYKRAVDASASVKTSTPHDDPPRESCERPSSAQTTARSEQDPDTQRAPSDAADAYTDELKHGYMGRKKRAAAKFAFKCAIILLICCPIFMFLANTLAEDVAPPDEGLTPAPFLNGAMIKVPSGDRVAPLTIETSGNDEYYIVLDPYDSVARDNGEMSFLVSAGSSVEIDVPLGEYLIYYACGPEWYGRYNRFGKNTAFYRCPGIFEFTLDGERCSGWTLTLYAVANGNMQSVPIPEDEFPDI